MRADSFKRSTHDRIIRELLIIFPASSVASFATASSGIGKGAPNNLAIIPIFPFRIETKLQRIYMGDFDTNSVIDE